MTEKKIVPKKKTPVKETTAIAKRKPTAVAKPEMSESGMLLQMAINKDLDPVRLDKFIDMHERMKKSQNKERFEEAFSQMKGELPIVNKTAEAKNDDGSVMYCFAPLEELQEKCDPILSKYGFAYYWEELYIEIVGPV